MRKRILGLAVGALGLAAGVFAASPFTFRGGTAVAGNGLLTGLVAYYKLDEGSGSGLDASGNSRTLTEQGTAVSVTGKISAGRKLDGSDGTDELWRADESAFELGSGDYTISFWAKRDSVAASGVAVWKGDAATPALSYNIQWQQTGPEGWAVQLSNAGAAWTDVVTGVDSPGGTLATNTWYFVCFRINGTSHDVKLAVGDEGHTTLTTGTGTFALSVFNGAGPLVIGSQYSGGGFGTAEWGSGVGYVDEIGFWNRYLSDSDVLLLFGSGAGYGFSNFTF